MSDIPEHLHEEILRRLPVKSLFRFRSVCKAWRGKIDDPGFAKTHISQGLGGNSILIKSKEGGKVFLLPMNSLINDSCESNHVEICMECPAKFIPDELHVPSCNGMMLLVWGCRDIWVIWNPFTGESVEGPQLSDSDLFGLRYRRRGLGYDEANNDYKVVWARDGCTFIYSVNSGACSIIKDFELPNWDCDFEEIDGVFANGALHWIGLVDERPEGSVTGVIVSLDLTTETYRSIKFSKEVEEYFERWHYLIRLVAFNGGLFLTSASSGRNFPVWKIDGSGYKEVMMSLEKSSINLLVFLESKYYKTKKDMFSWYETLNNCLKKVSMEVNPDANRKDDLCDTFMYKILPSSIARLKICDYGANEGAASKRIKIKVEKINWMMLMKGCA